jgi:acyl-CoA thioester hydrolase
MHTNEPSDSTGPIRFALPIRVYYEDTDAAGVVYYANYLRFCERARTECLREIGFEQQKLLAEQRIAFVVRSVKADYLSPGLLDDALQVESQLDSLGGASLVFAQRIRRGAELLFEGRFVIACVNLDKKRAAPLPADIRKKLEEFVRA